ncbi:hypothetical protein BHE74_00017163 [Ensete ventricosum]|nr:hypothetical protein BHE74_00017163 [Ensete ventricosum]
MLTSDDGTPVPPRDASLPVWPTEYCTCQRPSGFLLAVRDGSGAADPEIPSSRQRTIVTCLTREKRRKFEDANKAGGVGGEERRPMGVQGNKQFCFAAFPLSEPRRFLEPFFSLQFEAIRLPPAVSRRAFGAWMKVEASNGEEEKRSGSKRNGERLVRGRRCRRRTRWRVTAIQRLFLACKSVFKVPGTVPEPADVEMLQLLLGISSEPLPHPRVALHELIRFGSLSGT